MTETQFDGAAVLIFYLFIIVGPLTIAAAIADYFERNAK